jgi:hypothetical protein
MQHAPNLHDGIIQGHADTGTQGIGCQYGIRIVGDLGIRDIDYNSFLHSNILYDFE